MEFKIGFIASNLEMASTLMTMYPDLAKSGRLIIDIFDNKDDEPQGKELVKAGADIIIGRNGGYRINVGKVGVPLLKLKLSTEEVLKALLTAMKDNRKIVLFLWDQIGFDSELCKLFPAEIEMHTFSVGDEIESLFNRVISPAFDGIIVGEGIVCSLARQKQLPYVFVSSSKESIQEIMDHAIDVLRNLQETTYNNELLSTIVQGGHDALLAFDIEGTLMLFNDRARGIFKISPEAAIGRKVSDVLPELSFLVNSIETGNEYYGKLLQYKQSTLTYNASLIRIGEDIKGVLLSFQDITKLQRLEQKIRYELSDKGLVAKYTIQDIIYKEPIMADVIEKAKRIATSDSTAIIYGESGTGKEIIASSIHNLSDRKLGPFVAINCAALSESLLESELFGYEEGAFTGARKGGKLGLFELAHGGTIFLDEINSMPQSLQAKLLRVVEQKDIIRLGSDRVIPLDVRILCASNQDLYQLVIEEQFRKDLFYRLNSLEVYLPPLRERRGDIMLLFEFYLKQEMKSGQIEWPSDTEIHKLMTYSWPGNIRELKNVCQRYRHFHEVVLPKEEGLYVETPEALDHYNIDLKAIYRLIDRQIIEQLLAGGLNKTQVADLLGISRTALWKKLNDAV